MTSEQQRNKVKYPWGIGLTGGIATGKSTVAGYIRNAGYRVFDADQLARTVMTGGHPCAQAVTTLFGPEILDQSGTIDRKLLGQIVFADPQKRQSLERIVHPAIQEELDRLLRSCQLDQGGKLWFYEAALLFETGRYQDFQQTWCCICPPDIQLQRLMQRDGIDKNFAQQKIASQWSWDKKRQLADQLIWTDHPPAEVQRTVEKLLVRCQAETSVHRHVGLPR